MELEVPINQQKSNNTYRMSQNFRPSCPAVTIKFTLSASLQERHSDVKSDKYTHKQEYKR